jgi:hypothetical protein
VPSVEKPEEGSHTEDAEGLEACLRGALRERIRERARTEVTEVFWNRE